VQLLQRALARSSAMKGLTPLSDAVASVPSPPGDEDKAMAGGEGFLSPLSDLTTSHFSHNQPPSSLQPNHQMLQSSFDPTVVEPTEELQAKITAFVKVSGLTLQPCCQL
jgi:hypothetical protein